MQKVVVFLVMMLCLFGPMTLFVFVGNRALATLGNRPSEGSKVMIPFILKLMGAAALSMILLMVILKIYGVDTSGEGTYRFKDFDWHLVQ